MARQDPSRWMWAEACDALDRIERLHRRFFAVGYSAQQPVWEPPADVFDTGDAIVVEVALPGVNPDRIELSLADGALIVAGERALRGVVRTARIRTLEIPFGRFERRIALPEGRYVLDQRDDADGCVIVRLRRLR
ncbi:MAG: Hsp20/alpha crystallin family protein [Rhodospirillaceae bacterium]